MQSEKQITTLQMIELSTFRVKKANHYLLYRLSKAVGLIGLRATNRLFHHPEIQIDPCKLPMR